MNLNTTTFINYCNDMMIANEGIKDFFKERKLKKKYRNDYVDKENRHKYGVHKYLNGQSRITEIERTFNESLGNMVVSFMKKLLLNPKYRVLKDGMKSPTLQGSTSDPDFYIMELEDFCNELDSESYSSMFDSVIAPFMTDIVNFVDRNFNTINLHQYIEKDLDFLFHDDHVFQARMEVRDDTLDKIINQLK